MKPKLLVLAITVFCLFHTNYSTAFSKFSYAVPFEIDQNSDDEVLSGKEKEKVKENKKRNEDAVAQLDEIIKNLEEKKLKDKAEAMKAMRDHIKKNLERDAGTVLDEASDKAKDTAKQKNNKKSLKEYIGKMHSAIAKTIFDLNLVARGTGRTTGHIATLTVTNPSDQFFTLHDQLCYVPAVSKYQGYIIFIPRGINVGPGGVIAIPIYGYCANPKVPPVPDGGDFPPFDDWIPINKTPTGGFGLDGDKPTVSEPMNPPNGSSGPPHHTTPIFVSDHETLPSFDPGMMGTISESPGFSPEDDADEDSDSGIEATWPGTTEGIVGTIDPTENPDIFAQVVAEALMDIIDVTDTIQSSGKYPTPFSNDKEKEKEAILQQTFWIFVAALMGEEYEEEDFMENIYEQFKAATGQDIKEAPPEQKEQVDEGGGQFWDVYVAVGVEAKVISTEPKSEAKTVPISNPENETPPEESDEDCCESMSSCYFNPQLDFDMQIADQWASLSERNKIISECRASMENNIDISEGEAFDEYDISKNPTSATAFWKPGVVGGFASAHAKTWFKREDGSSGFLWGTNRLDTNAEGNMNCSLTYDTGDDCRAIVAGTALIRIRASSSAFDAMAGNNQDEDDENQLAFLRTTKYGAEKALEWLILRGRGKTNQSFQDHVRDDLQEQVEGEITSAIEQEAQALANNALGGILNDLGLTLSDLNFELPSLEESLEELLGIDIPSLSDIEETISEGIEASLNLFFVSNTYATANGSLTVGVGSNSGSVRAHTSVIYGRQGAENTSEAIRWTGADCKENFISDVQPNALTITTQGYANLVSEAVSKFGFGNGSAEAFLESMNLQMLAGLCIFEENDSTKFSLDVVGNLGWYANSKEHQESLKGALESLENDIQNALIGDVSDFQKTPGNSSLENYTGDMLKNALEQKIRDWASDHPFYWSDCSE